MEPSTISPLPRCDRQHLQPLGDSQFQGAPLNAVYKERRAGGGWLWVPVFHLNVTPPKKKAQGGNTLTSTLGEGVPQKSQAHPSSTVGPAGGHSRPNLWRGGISDPSCAGHAARLNPTGDRLENSWLRSFQVPARNVSLCA